MLKTNKVFIVALFLSIVLNIILIVYDVRLDDDAYYVLLRNRFTGLGLGIELCNQKTTPQKQCMNDHKNSFEIWHFAHTVHGGVAGNRFYPSLEQKNNQIVTPSFTFNKLQYNPTSDPQTLSLSDSLVVVGFQARTADSVSVPTSFIALGKKNGEKFKYLQYLSGNDYYSKLELHDLASDGISEIFFWSTGGAHHQDLDVYKIHNKKLEKIFTAGSACGLDELKDGRGRLSAIKIYFGKLDVPGWSYADCPSDRYTVWKWEKDKFIFDKKQSSVNEQSTVE